MPHVLATANDRYPADDRQFHPDRFAVDSHSLDGVPRVLVIDDTWTTGARVQSLAFALKAAGAVKVGAVVLGRHVNPADGVRYEHYRLFNERLRKAPEFDESRCSMGDAGGEGLAGGGLVVED
ncbi:hypothetical protein GCM10010434_032770 [Winogradskya humida]